MLRAVLMGSAARRIVVVLTLVLGTPAGVIIAGATPQASAACSPTSHCYAIAYNKNTATNHGAYGVVNSACLYMPNNSSFVTNEVWDVDSSGAYWEEVGIVSGATDSGYLDKHWFWDDSRPGGGYHQHNSSATASPNTGYRVKIEFAGSDTWDIYGNGNYSHFGTSTSQSATLITNEAGTEYSAGSGSGMRNVGQVSDLQRISSSGTFFNWGSNAAPYSNGFIGSNYDASSSTVSWTGPC